MSKTKRRITLLFLAILLPFLAFSELYFLKTTLSATGIPKILNYQGRLLNSSGDLLGGSSGVNYCFKFSFYSDATVGSPDTKLWPSAEPSTMTINVKDGVFNAAVGDIAGGGDLLDFNFQDNDTIYLNVEVAAQISGSCSGVSFENLSPRQRIYSSGYSINALTVGGYTPSQTASSNQIPVLSSGNLVLGGANPQLNAISNNTLTLQGGGGTGDIQFFSSSNKITSSGALTVAGTLTSNGLTVNGYSLNLSGNLNTAGGFPITLIGQASTTLTLPTSGTLLTLDGNEIFTNKTISGANNTITNIATSSLATSTLTVNAGVGLINGGLVGLGGSVILDVGVGDGIATSSDAISIKLTSTGTSTATSTNSGLEVLSSGLSLLRGCSGSQILKWNSSTNVWECSADLTGGGGSLTVKESDGSPLIANVVTLEFGTSTNSSDELLVTDQGGGVARVILGNKAVKTDTSQALTNKTYEGLTITNTTGVLTIASGKTLSASSTIGFSGTDATNFVFPSASGTVATLNATQALINKTYNGLNISASGTLTLAANKNFTVNNTLTLAGTDATNFTFPTASGTVATLDANQAFTNKTYNGLNITSTTGTLTIASGKTLTASNTITLAGADATVFTFPTASGTVATLAANQALTNKTYEGLTITNTTGVLTIASGKTLSASSTLGFSGTDNTNFVFPSASGTVATLNATQALINKTYNGLNISASGTLTLAANKNFTVNNTLTLAGTDATNFTFPTASGTVATLDANQAFTNKTISGANNTITNIATSSLATSTLTVNAGVGLINGGLVGLGGSITVDVGAGNGIATSSDAISIKLTSTGTSTNTSSNSGLEISSSGLAILRGCANGEILKWSSGTGIWQCGADVSGGSPTLDTIAAAIADGAVRDSNANTVNWNWDFVSAGADSGLNISESSASINGLQDQQALLKITTLAGSTASPLQIISNSADVGDIFINLASLGDFEIRDNGAAFVTFDDTGTSTFSGQLVLSSNSNVGISGGGLVNCNASNQVLQWDSTTNKFSCLTVSGGAPDTASFTDTTLDSAVSFTTENDLWDGTQPNITPDGTSNTVLVAVVIDISESGTADANYAFRIHREVGAAATCTSAEVGLTFRGTFLTSAAGDDTQATAIFLDSPATTSQVNYTVCTYIDGEGVGDINTIAVTLVELGADLAENYYTNDDSIGVGDVVVIDSSLPAGVKKSAQPYEKDIVGAVSTAPGITLDDAIGLGYGRKVPVALAGRIPIKVSTENGRVKSGDLLTSSNIPGVAMRATKTGRIIGQALQDFNYPDGGIGLITVFVNNAYYQGAALTFLLPGLNADTATSTPADFGKQILSHLIAQKELLTATSTLSEIFTDRLAAALEIISPRILTQGLVVESISAFDKEIAFKNDIIFFGRPYFTTDTAGFAVIKTGDRRVDVVFDREYLEQPIVNAGISSEDDSDSADENILGNNINYIVTKKTTKGFSIVLNKPAPQNIKFSWIVLAVNGVKTFTSKSNPQIITNMGQVTANSNSPTSTVAIETISATSTSDSAASITASSTPSTSASTTSGQPPTSPLTENIISSSTGELAPQIEPISSAEFIQPEADSSLSPQTETTIQSDTIPSQ